MDTRRTLPIVALIASAILFGGAIIFALQPGGGGSSATATPQRVALRSPVAGAIVAVGTATATPVADEPEATPTAEPEPEPSPSGPAPAATLRATARAAMATATAPVVARTPSAGMSAGIVTPPASSPPTAPPVVNPTTPPVAAPPTPTPTRPPAAPPVAAPPTPTPTPPPPPTATPRPPAVPPPPAVAGPPPRNVGVPVRVLVPSLGIDAAVEQVGIDGDGNMATPDNPWNTAWYAPGSRPGQPGNAAIAGHVDYRDIGPVVFWDLNKLKAGDEVLVVTDAGQTLRFTVRGSQYFRPESAPLEQVFGPASTPNLNLITCGGAFNPQTRQYDQRLVVFTTYAGQ